MSIPSFKIFGTSDKFWNKDQFVKFLFDNRDQPIEITVAPEAVCMQTLGVYQLLQYSGHKDVTVITANPLEYHASYKIRLLENHWPKKTEDISPDLHQWDRSRLFHALFGRPTAARLAIASYIKKYHAYRSVLHFSAKTDVDDLIHFELDKLLAYRVSSIKDLSCLIEHLPLLLSSPERYTDSEGYDFSDPLTQNYKHILIDLVVESHVSGNTFYATEKTFRSMWMKKPFIIFASQNYLEYLRQMGFQTFWQFWDEGYDGFEAKDRLQSILNLIDDLASRPPSDLDQMYQSMQPILEHNYRLLKTKTFTTEIVKID